MDEGASLLSSAPAPRVRPTQRCGAVLAIAVALSWIQAWLSVAIDMGHAFARHRLDSSQRLLGALFAEALTAEERSRLTVRIYDFYPGYRRIGTHLHGWEQIWFQRRLPPPSACILVGACGRGREAIALVEQGYRVDTFDPAPEFVAEARRCLGARAAVWEMRYEDLSAAVLDGRAIAGVDLRRAFYDAIVLGHGSLTHVLDPREQARLLRALDLLCPSGPILASFFCDEGKPAASAPLGYAVRLGAAIGRRLGKLRGIRSGDSAQQSYRQHMGFAYTFARTQIEDLGRLVNRQVKWESEDVRSFHATFLPPGADPASPSPPA